MLVFQVTHAEQKRTLPFSEVQDKGINFLSVCFICATNDYRWYFLYPESSAIIEKAMQLTTLNVPLEFFLPKH